VIRKIIEYPIIIIILLMRFLYQKCRLKDKFQHKKFPPFSNFQDMPYFKVLVNINANSQFDILPGLANRLEIGLK